MASKRNALNKEHILVTNIWLAPGSCAPQSLIGRNRTWGPRLPFVSPRAKLYFKGEKQHSRMLGSERSASWDLRGALCWTLLQTTAHYRAITTKKEESSPLSEEPAETPRKCPGPDSQTQSGFPVNKLFFPKEQNIQRTPRPLVNRKCLICNPEKLMTYYYNIQDSC